MKLIRIKIILLAALALGGVFGAQAQSNSAPGDTDYAQFSRFISDRNIFDPNRYPRNSRSSAPRRNTTRTHTTRPAGTPFITLVGTMSYEKGLFAFFNSNDSETKKVSGVDGEIAGYKIKVISAGEVVLTGADQKEIPMKIGDSMHQEGNRWVLNDHNDSAGSAPADAATDESASGNEAAPADNASETPAATSSANLDSNDVLKRLMQLREKENQ